MNKPIQGLLSSTIPENLWGPKNSLPRIRPFFPIPSTGLKQVKGSLSLIFFPNSENPAQLESLGSSNFWDDHERLVGMLFLVKKRERADILKDQHVWHQTS